MRVEEDQQSLVLYAKKCMEEGSVDQIIDPYLKLEVQSNSLEEFIKVVEKCLLKQPKERPSMAQVVANLELVLENQQGKLSSTSEEVESNWTAQFVDPTSDERYTNIESEYSFSEIETRPAYRPPLVDSLELYGYGDGEGPNVEQSGNGCGTHQIYEEISQLFSFEQSIRIFSFSELEVATKNFHVDLKIGENDDGDWYKGWLAEPIGSQSLVLVNRWRPGNISFSYFQNEMKMMKALSHPNLLNLMGYCCENDKFLSVHKFIYNGNLDNHLFFTKDSSVQPLSWESRLKICSDVARGLAFMHSLERPIIHRDIKPSIILLDESYNAMVSGFSLARFGPTGNESTHISTKIIGTHGYAAPEYILTGHLHVKNNVYSFGVILVEMLTGHPAIDLKRPTYQRSLIDWTKVSLSNKRKLKQIMDPCLEGQYSTSLALQVAELALKCLDALPKSRPSMEEVLQTLEHIQSTNRET